MTAIGQLLLFILRLFELVLVVRIVIEMIRSFARRFDPPKWFYVIAEPLFVVTDPPVKALRRVIPPLRTGGIALDISVIVLFFIIQLLIMLVGVVFFSG